jgi:glutathione S-transferase
LGRDLSLIDLIIAPWAVRVWFFDHFKVGLKVEKGDLWERWGRWMSAVQGRECVVCMTSER